MSGFIDSFSTWRGPFPSKIVAGQYLIDRGWPYLIAVLKAILTFADLRLPGVPAIYLVPLRDTVNAILSY